MSDTDPFELVYVNPRETRITADSFGRLHLQCGDQHHENIRPVRSFPLTQPEKHIALLDPEGKQIAMIADLRELDRESRTVLERELEMMYFMPHVLAIRHVKSRHGVTTWMLETDHGERIAYVKDRGDIRTLPDGRIILTDVHGIKYEIGDPARLDERSQAFLESET